MPFRPPVRAANTRMLASLSEAAGGSTPALDQSALRQLRGRSSVNHQAAWASTGTKKTSRMTRSVYFSTGSIGGLVRRVLGK
jgi:hypothetical protein